MQYLDRAGLSSSQFAFATCPATSLAAAGLLSSTSLKDLCKLIAYPCSIVEQAFRFAARARQSGVPRCYLSGQFQLETSGACQSRRQTTAPVAATFGILGALLGATFAVPMPPASEAVRQSWSQQTVAVAEMVAGGQKAARRLLAGSVIAGKGESVAQCLQAAPDSLDSVSTTAVEAAIVCL